METLDFQKLIEHTVINHPSSSPAQCGVENGQGQSSCQRLLVMEIIVLCQVSCILIGFLLVRPEGCLRNITLYFRAARP